MTYCLIKRVKIGPAQLLYSSVAENEVPLYNPAATYAIDATVLSTVTHRIYRSVRDANIGRDPTLDANIDVWWQDIAPTNRWAMFDDVAGTFTTSASAPLIVEVRPGIAFDSVALLDLSGGATVLVEAIDGTTTLYQANVQISSVAPSKSWWEYFMVTGSAPKPRHMILADLPTISASAKLRVTFTDGAPLSVGTLMVGTRQEIGRMLAAPKLGIRDFSKKKKDEEFGTVSLLERTYAKTLQAQFKFDSYYLDGIYAALADVRATPAIFFDTVLPNEVYTVFGYYTDLTIDVPYSSYSLCTLYLESMT